MKTSTLYPIESSDLFLEDSFFRNGGFEFQFDKTGIRN